MDSLVSLLPAPLQRYAKALVPVLVVLVAILQDHTIDAAEVNDLALAVGGAVTALIVLLVPNKS